MKEPDHVQLICHKEKLNFMLQDIFKGVQKGDQNGTVFMLMIKISLHQK